MAQLIFVRHGRTFSPGEPSRRIGSRTDLPLTDEGVREAVSLASYFSDRPLRAIWSGRLRRSRQTASIIAAGQRRAGPIRTLRLLDEIDHGLDENRTEAEIVARIGADQLAAWEAHLIAPPGWELDLPFRQRGWRRIAGALSAMPASECVLAIGSQGAIRLAAQTLGVIGASLIPKMKPGHYGILTFGAGGPATMVEWDRAPTGEGGDDRQHSDARGRKA